MPLTFFFFFHKDRFFPGQISSQRWCMGEIQKKKRELTVYSNKLSVFLFDFFVLFLFKLFEHQHRPSQPPPQHRIRTTLRTLLGIREVLEVLITFTSVDEQILSDRWCKMPVHFCFPAPSSTVWYARPFCTWCGRILAFRSQVALRQRPLLSCPRCPNSKRPRTTTRSTVPKRIKACFWAFCCWCWPSSRWFCSSCWSPGPIWFLLLWWRWTFASSLCTRCLLSRRLLEWYRWVFHQTEVIVRKGWVEEIAEPLDQSDLD